MKVFKFGGASVKDANGVRNIISVLRSMEEAQLIIIVSAMGKTTNSLEKAVDAYFSDPKNIDSSIQSVYDYHFNIISNLFDSSSHPIFNEITQLIREITLFLKTNKSKQHAFVYDQVVSYGELISTLIISHYLNDNGIENLLLDARDCIKTDEIIVMLK